MRDWAHWAQTVITIVLLFAVVAMLLWVKSINDQLAAAQTQQQLSDAQFQIFLKAFAAETDYDCQVLWEINHTNSSIPMNPPLSICHVTAP